MHKYENNVDWWVGRTISKATPIKDKDGWITEVEVVFSDGWMTRFWTQDNIIGVVTMPNNESAAVLRSNIVVLF